MALVTSSETVAQEVWPGIFVGGYKCAINLNFLQEMKITAIVTAALNLDQLFPVFKTEMAKVKAVLGPKNVLQLHLVDSVDQGITPAANVSTDFIRSVLQGRGKVLVHCAMGVSRSASMVAAYLILDQGLTYGDAIKTIKSARPIVQPNPGFARQLMALQPGKVIGVEEGACR